MIYLYTTWLSYNFINNSKIIQLEKINNLQIFITLDLLNVEQALANSASRQFKAPSAVKNLLQDFVINDDKRALVQFQELDHGVQPYDLFTTQGITLNQGWMGLSYDPLTMGYGNFMLIIAKDCMELVSIMHKLFSAIPLQNIIDIRIILDSSSWPAMPIDQHPGQLYWARKNYRIPAEYFKNSKVNEQQVFGIRYEQDLSTINNQAVPGYLLGINDGTMYSRQDGYFIKQVSHVSNREIIIEDQVYNALVRSFIAFLSLHDWQTINYQTKLPHCAIQSILCTERKANNLKFQFIMNKLSLPNDKLILVNGLKYSPPNLLWESKHTPKDRMSPAKRLLPNIHSALNT